MVDLFLKFVVLFIVNLEEEIYDDNMSKDKVGSGEKIK